MLTAKLGLAPATRRALQAAGIEHTDQLQRPANELLATEPITGAMLYDVVCRLRAHRLGLRANPLMSLPSATDLEMLRLRVVEGLSLRDIGSICSVSPEARPTLRCGSRQSSRFKDSSSCSLRARTPTLRSANATRASV